MKEKQMIMENSDDAESWLWLGELRNIVRMVCNANPSTEEEDEIYFSSLFNLIGISSIN